MLNLLKSKLIVLYGFFLYALFFVSLTAGQTAETTVRRRRLANSGSGTRAINDASLGGMADNLSGVFGMLATFLHIGSFIIGVVFTVGAFIKLKQHKDNPIQTPISFPIVLFIFGIIFLAMPIVTSLPGYDFLSSTLFQF